MSHRRTLLSAALLLTLLATAGGAIASQQDTYDAITGEMAAIRELPLLEELNIEIHDREQLREFVLQDLEENYPLHDREADLRVLVIFGLVEPGTDLLELQTDILGEQIAGYYDPETDEMVVVSDSAGEEISASDELTFAHETVHALQDQHFDLLAVQGEPDTLTDDQSLAITALIEGDATVGQLEYLLANPLLIRALQDELSDFDSSALDSAPRVYAETLLFPYEQGADFVSELFDEGGWDAVDAAYESPPQSTEQILHPEKYIAGEGPVAVEIYDPIDALGDDWRIFDLNAMGELITRIFLDGHGVDEDEATVAAEGWGGDQYVVVGTDDETALVWRSAWDTEQDADEFFAALTQHELRRFDTRPESRQDDVVRFKSDGVAGEIRRDGTEVLYILAPDEATLDTLAEVQMSGGTPLTLPIERGE